MVVEGLRGERRLAMLLSVAEYAGERLAELGTNAVRGAEERHARYYAGLGQSMPVQAGTARWSRLQQDMNNLVIATHRSVDAGWATEAAGACLAALAVWEVTGPFGTAVALAKRVEPMDLPTSLRGVVLLQIGSMLQSCGEYREAQAWQEKAKAFAETHGLLKMQGNALCNMGLIHLYQSRLDEAERCYEHALNRIRSLDCPYLEARILTGLGGVRQTQQRMEEARTLFERSLTKHREMGSRLHVCRLLLDMGDLEGTLGRHQVQMAHFQEALDLALELGSVWLEGVARGHLANSYRRLGQLEQAEACFQTALGIHRKVGNRRFEGIVVGNYGGLLWMTGRVEEATACYEEALVIHRELGNRQLEANVHLNQGILSRYQGHLEEALAGFQRALRAFEALGDTRLVGITLRELGSTFGQKGDFDQARDAFDRGEQALRLVNNASELAKLLCKRGRVEVLDGLLPVAHNALTEAEAIVSALSTATDVELNAEIDKLRTALSEAESDAGES